MGNSAPKKESVVSKSDEDVEMKSYDSKLLPTSTPPASPEEDIKQQLSLDLSRVEAAEATSRVQNSTRLTARDPRATPREILEVRTSRLQGCQDARGRVLSESCPGGEEHPTHCPWSQE